MRYACFLVIYLQAWIYLSLRYTIVNSENYRNYLKCQFKRRNTTFPPFHASNRFEGKTNFAAFVGCTRRDETRRCGIANCGLLFAASSLRPPFCGDCVAQKCSKRCRLHSMRADANANRPKLDRFEPIWVRCWWRRWGWCWGWGWGWSGYSQACPFAFAPHKAALITHFRHLARPENMAQLSTCPISLSLVPLSSASLSLSLSLCLPHSLYAHAVWLSISLITFRFLVWLMTTTTMMMMITMTGPDTCCHCCSCGCCSIIKLLLPLAILYAQLHRSTNTAW